MYIVHKILCYVVPLSFFMTALLSNVSVRIYMANPDAVRSEA